MKTITIKNLADHADSLYKLRYNNHINKPSVSEREDIQNRIVAKFEVQDLIRYNSNLSTIFDKINQDYKKEYNDDALLIEG